MADVETPALLIRDLRCERAGRELFTGLHASVRDGGALQVGGANGSGKTSLLRILCGLARADDGEVLWQGRPITDPGAAYRADLHYLGHGNAIKLHLTARENVDFMIALRPAGTAAADPQAVLARIGLSAHAHMPTQRLSAGQRRRLGLARLLASPARLWILDEPFTSLDSDGRLLVAELIAGHRREGGVAVVATHLPLPAAAGPDPRTLELA